MDTEKVHAILSELNAKNDKIRRLDSHNAVNEAVGECWLTVDGLAAELAPGDTPQRFGPLIYSLRSIYDSIYGQIEQTRALVDIPQLVDWSDAVIARIARELSEPAPAEVPAGVASAPTIPEGAKEFVIFESLARPGYRVACYHTMGIGDELFGIDGKPRVPPDPTKWRVVAYTKLPEGLDLIPPAALTLPGDDGSPDWYAAAPPVPVEVAPAGEQAGEQNGAE